jgi:hypothetical protein
MQRIRPGRAVIADLPHLRQLSGLKRRSDIRRWLRKNGVPFMVQPSGDPVTTLDAINRAMYGNSKYNKPDFTPPPCSRPKSIKDTAGITTSTKTNGTRSAESVREALRSIQRSRPSPLTVRQPTDN